MAIVRSTRKLRPLGKIRERHPGARHNASGRVATGRAHCDVEARFFAGMNEGVADRHAIQTDRLPAMEVMADPSSMMSAPRGEILDLLLGAACPAAAGGSAALMRLWNDEAILRASDMIRLMLLLDLHTWSRARESLNIQLEYRLARDLAVLFRSLDIACDDEMRPCSDTLRNIVADLADLFGSALPHVTVRARLERLSLAACKRRALVLAATNLLMDGLFHALAGRSGGRIDVTLERVSPSSARLTVMYDGDASEGRLRVRHDIVDRLAGLLEADLTYRTTAYGTIDARIQFSAPAPPGSGRVVML